MSFASMGDILQSKKQQNQSSFDAVAAAISFFKKTASEIIPEEVRRYYTIGHLTNGIMYLEVEHASYAQAINFYKHILLRKMAMSQRSIGISDIRIVQKRK